MTITACAICHRAVWAEDVNVNGACVTCEPYRSPAPETDAPHEPTEAEKADLFRGEDA